ncbi:alpha-glucuronidase family glycosyl hydrolase [Gynuella sunshinyii]|uniref:Xylan alpha-1,2-glucuronidase n=1 Tax=Gynuella sunshinyii YC6258 TaxID=1445510 RepID=A0A0C5VLK0_9GAMM|nr:alpha-glucuronidase family glycosyl hydrolase [Gynuella sunshinyii]AJQ94203.1 alpha-glucuronidase [Gynuella sunshinyii YC6258]
MRILTLLLVIAASLASLSSHAEDGYDLWLRYQTLPESYAKDVNRTIKNLVPGDINDPTRALAIEELQTGFSKMLGKPLPIKSNAGKASLMLLTSEALAQISNDVDTAKLTELGDEGYLLTQAKINNKPVTLIAANSEQGLLYGAFELLQQMQLQTSLKELNHSSSPKIQRRVLNHWDNLDGSVERGYAGSSIWDWWELPGVINPRYKDYARANAALGINGTVLNNVNSKAISLDHRYIEKAAALAEVFRPYGIKVYLSARFNAPMELDGFENADPQNPKVRQWWKDKAKEIYQIIPNFGGFLVKANSEGQPGPGDYGRSHAEGANMLAEALEPYGGIVMWRAFVYSEHDAEDRGKQAYNEFKPLDGKFKDNVLLQVKNGPIDFQPREPYHPLFGAMPNTPLMMEFQITKEYLGFATHIAYLAPLYQEVLAADTFAKGKGSTVAKVIDGSLDGHKLTGIAGVANIGHHRNWSGSIFNQANWYAFGRLAWDPYADSQTIGRDWLALTFTNEEQFTEPTLGMMMRSREAVVDYMTPLGLAHLMATGHHYGPGPWVSDLGRPEWNPAYYHKADKNGIGFDRTKTGSNALAQYSKEVAQSFADPKTMDERYLLWFHHLPWDFKLQSGKTLWQGLVEHYDHGVEEAKAMQQTWQSLKPYVDQERFTDTAQRLQIQVDEAQWWRDASLAYFSHVSGKAIPQGTTPPKHDLQYYIKLSFPYAPGN